MKRLSTTDPLTADDVAERLDKAALRTLRILSEVAQDSPLREAVRSSRYLRGTLEALRDELNAWHPDAS